MILLETEGSGAIGLVFLDKTTLSLSEGGKMVLDELVYDPATGTGSMGINMVEGAFSFISGEIAKTGPDAMQIETPVVTMGIRGTTVAGKVWLRVMRMPLHFYRMQMVVLVRYLSVMMEVHRF